MEQYSSYEDSTACFQLANNDGVNSADEYNKIAPLGLLEKFFLCVVKNNRRRVFDCSSCCIILLEFLFS